MAEEEEEGCTLGLRVLDDAAPRREEAPWKLPPDGSSLGFGGSPDAHSAMAVVYMELSMHGQFMDSSMHGQLSMGLMDSVHSYGQ